MRRVGRHGRDQTPPPAKTRNSMANGGQRPRDQLEAPDLPTEHEEHFVQDMDPQENMSNTLSFDI